MNTGSAKDSLCGEGFVKPQTSVMFALTTGKDLQSFLELCCLDQRNPTGWVGSIIWHWKSLLQRWRQCYPHRARKVPNYVVIPESGLGSIYAYRPENCSIYETPPQTRSTLLLSAPLPSHLWRAMIYGRHVRKSLSLSVFFLPVLN